MIYDPRRLCPRLVKHREQILEGSHTGAYGYGGGAYHAGEHSGGSSNTSEGCDGLPSVKSQHFPLPTKASCAFVWWLFSVVTAPAPTVRFPAALRHAQVPVTVVGSRR
jgi:hypothetical protein